MNATMVLTTIPTTASLERPWEDEGETGVADNKAVLVVAVAGEVDVGARVKVAMLEASAGNDSPGFIMKVEFSAYAFCTAMVSVLFCTHFSRLPK